MRPAGVAPVPWIFEDEYHGSDGGHLRAIRRIKDRLIRDIEDYTKGPCPKYDRLPEHAFEVAGLPFPYERGGSNFWALLGGIAGVGVTIWWGGKLLAPLFGPFGPVWVVVG